MSLRADEARDTTADHEVTDGPGASGGACQMPVIANRSGAAT